MNITKKSHHQFSHFFHKNNHNSRTKKDYIIYYTGPAIRAGLAGLAELVKLA